MQIELSEQELRNIKTISVWYLNLAREPGLRSMAMNIIEKVDHTLWPETVPEDITREELENRESESQEFQAGWEQFVRESIDDENRAEIDKIKDEFSETWFNVRIIE